MRVKDFLLTPASAPHLKSGVSFVFNLMRETAGTGLLFLTLCFIGGAEKLFLNVVFLTTLMAADKGFCFLASSPKPQWDFSILNQGFLNVLFLPANLPIEVGAFVGGVLAGFYRLSGGRAAYVLQPAALVLAFLAGLGYSPAFALMQVSGLFAAVLFSVWFVIRFPRTQNETLQMAAVLGAGVLMAVLHETAWTTALLWCAAAGEILFDRALIPLTKRGRNYFYGVIFILFALLAASGPRVEALVITGLTSGFFAAWIERRTGAKDNL